MEVLMAIELGFTEESWNTQYAPLAALFYHYQHNDILKPLESVKLSMKTRDFSFLDKLKQILLSIMCGCETFSEINVSLKHESALAKTCGWERFSDQSNMSRSIDVLTLMNIEQLEQAKEGILGFHRQFKQHDWRNFLWFDFDLTGLTCGKLAEESKKGYFSGKKTQRVGS